jgi:transposase
MSTMSRKMWVAMDLSDKANEYCALDDAGRKIASGKVLNTPEVIRDFFGKFDKKIDLTAIIEAGTCSPWISHIIKSCGHKLIVANPRKVRAIWDTANKTDERDAELLARLGRVDPSLLKPIKHRCMDEQFDLSTARLRETLVQTRSKLSNCVKSTLKSLGVILETRIEPAYLPARLPALLSKEYLELVRPMLAAIGGINAQIKRYDEKIVELCHKYPECNSLVTIRGVGALTAVVFRLTISDPDRLLGTRDVGPYLGLTPKRDQSGEIDKRLGISKAGDKLCRTMLIRAANYIIGPFGADSDIRRFGTRIKNKGGKAPTKRAACAVARKLAVTMLAMWKSGEEYQPFRFAAGKQRVA